MTRHVPTGLSRRGFITVCGVALARPGSWLTLPQRRDPYALVLGTAQDGGLPQIGCYSTRCEAARSQRKYVASLALVHPDDQRFYLVDATPDITTQVDLIAEPAFRQRAADRNPFDGIFLTHAHIGHYLGLAMLGREGLGISPTNVYCSRSMETYLRENGPWSLLVDEGRLNFPEPVMKEWFDVDEWLSVRMLAVPHRPEFSDTVGFVFRGPRASLLYVPDIDRWEAWDHSIAKLATEVDTVLIDGSFYSGDEVPGRRIEDIPHPLIPHSMDLLQSAVDSGARVVFTHLNNTNPAHDEGQARRAILDRGFEVAMQGMQIPL